MDDAVAIPNQLSTWPRPAVVPAERAAAASLETLYRAEYGRLVGLAVLLVDDRETAEEVVQDAFVHLHHRWSTVDNPVGYLRRSVVNGGRDVQRRRKVRRRQTSEEPKLSGLDVNHLTDVLSTLPTKQRAAIVLRYCEDLAEAEIAEALGVRPGTVRTLIRRGLTELRKQVPR